MLALRIGRTSLSDRNDTADGNGVVDSASTTKAARSTAPHPLSVAGEGTAKLRSGSGVCGVHGGPHAFPADVRIDLGRLQVGMAQQLLYRTQIGPTVEQVGGETVTERMGMGENGRAAIDDAPNVAGGQPLATGVAEQLRPAAGGQVGRTVADELGLGACDVCPECRHRSVPDRHQALLGALAQDAGQAALKVEIAQVDAAQLRHPQPGAVQQLEDGVVAGRGRAFGVGVLVEQLAKLVGAQHAG